MKEYTEEQLLELYYQYQQEMEQWWYLNQTK